MKLYLVKNLMTVGAFAKDGAAGPQHQQYLTACGDVVFVTDTYKKARRFVEQNVDKVPEGFIGGNIFNVYQYGYDFFGLAIEEIDIDQPLGASAVGQWTYDKDQPSRPVVSELLNSDDDTLFFELAPEVGFTELFPAEANRPKKEESESEEEAPDVSDDDDPFVDDSSDDEAIAEPDRP